MPYRPHTPAPTRAAALVASVLTVDAVLHLYWTTGATWPAADDKSLSHAVLGTEVPFTPPTLRSAPDGPAVTGKAPASGAWSRPTT